jgi:Second Messenger Oligonucleotide or Dinucleotide Synthetase domain
MNVFSYLPSSPQSGLSGLIPNTQTPAPPLGIWWIAVRQRFQQFHDNLVLTPRQQQDGMTKAVGVVECLSRHYYATSSTDHGFLIGSWGKNTATRPPRDVDLYFLLPNAVYTRFEAHSWNRQSALLREVKEILLNTYPDTDTSGDGQVVVVGFDSYNVEVVPAFALANGNYWICNTNDGGSYKETNPRAESNYINTVDQANNRNLRPLIRMMKAWQDYCSVPLKSFQLELVAVEFIVQSPWRLYDYFWFDWITRDFFAYLYRRANTHVAVPGTGEQVFLGDEWQSRAESAYYRAVKACEHDKYNRVEAAGDEWQKIFGVQIPRTV